MHRAANYLDGLFPTKVKRVVVESRVLNPGDVASVCAALPADAEDYFYSACVSLLEGFLAIDAGFYTWSTVKLYYATFYAVRAMIAWDNYAVFWPTDEAPYRVRGAVGESPRLMSGKGSHKAMIGCFKNLYPSHFLLSQPVDSSGAAPVDGFMWLMARREEANYVIARFCEPEMPEHYGQIVRLGVRRAILDYLDPANAILTFDREHAIASFPLAAIRYAGDAAKANGGVSLFEDEAAFLSRKCRDRKGIVAPLVTFIRGTLK